MGARAIRFALLTGIAMCGALLLLGPAASGRDGGSVAYSFELNGEINPASAAYLDHALDEAADEGAGLAIIRLDTPGGLLDSLRDMNKDILAAPMPVVVFTYPPGSRAASAGAFLTQAADIAAMAPETNIGSSTPITIGPGSDDEVLGRKIRNDAKAYMRALTVTHGRNAAPGEEMVTRAVNLTAREALDQGFIDVIATDQTDLLRQLDGFEVKGPKAQTLDTTGMQIEEHSEPLRYKILGLLVNPTIAFLLVLVGVVGIAIEIISPGLIVPGVLGAIALVLGLFGGSQLPVNAIGVVFLVLGIALLLTEAFLPTHGILGGAGVITLVLAGLLLFKGDEGAHISVPVVIGVGVLLGALILTASTVALRARELPVRTGPEELVGQPGTVRTALSPDGQVLVGGALWQARVPEGTDRAEPGETVTVREVDGLTLTVERNGGIAGARDG